MRYKFANHANCPAIVRCPPGAPAFCPCVQCNAYSLRQAAPRCCNHSCDNPERNRGDPEHALRY